MKSKTKVKKIVNLALKLAIILFTLFFLYIELVRDKDIVSLFVYLKQAFLSPQQVALMVFALLLMPLNLILEAKKWQLLIRKIEYVKLGKAFTAVLTGISVGMFLPNRMGDYLGRVFVLEKGDRIKGIMTTIIGSFSQLICTIVAGCVALTFAYPTFYEVDTSFKYGLFAGLCCVAFLLIAVTLFFYFNIGILNTIFRHLLRSRFKKIETYIAVFELYSKKELGTILLLSALRYLIFSFQFVLLLWAFSLPIAYFNALMLVAIMYFFMTMIPTFTIAEPGIRGSLSIFIFEKWFSIQGLLMTSTGLLVFASSTIVWIFNLALPALAGVFYVYRLKFFRK
ncbi:MAG: flippase-like domain-containing protein [Lentimicrobiaceae bacterium]|jgi:uncharacterized membrane protein YbhN (UPF0104 family)|nr:flippase-like domain-containing protein [Lentimicrobiaceae bacterium]